MADLSPLLKESIRETEAFKLGEREAAAEYRRALYRILVEVTAALDLVGNPAQLQVLPPDTEAPW